MPYLICEECNGYYKLEEEESPQDFESCSCGGRLIYSSSSDEIHEGINSLPSVCNKCGNENHNSLSFCSNCGDVLMPLNTSNIGLYQDQNERMSNIGKVSSLIFIGGLLVIFTVIIGENLFLIP